MYRSSRLQFPRRRLYPFMSASCITPDSSRSGTATLGRILFLLALLTSLQVLAGSVAAQALDLTPLRTARIADSGHSSRVNPAFLAFLENPSLSLWYRSYYALSDLNSTGLEYESHVIGIGIGMKIAEMGLTDIRRQFFSPALGVRFGAPDSTSLAIGISILFDRLTSRQTDVVRRSIRLGMIAPITRSTDLGLVLNQRLVSSRLQPADGITIAGGLIHRISQKIATSVDYYYCERFGEQYFLGVEIQYSRSLAADLEWSQKPVVTLVQIRFNHGNFLVHLAGSFHEVLGWSRSVRISFTYD